MKNFALAVLFCALASAKVQSSQSTETTFTVGAEYGYDDNVVVEEIDLTTSEGDNFIRLRAKGEIEYALSKDTEISASLGINDLRYDDADQFDLRTWLGAVGFSYEISDVTFGLDFRHADAELGGEGFLNLTHISPSVSSFLSKRHFVRGAYTYMDKSLDNNPARDATSNEFAADYYFFKNGLTQYFIFSGKVRFDDAEDDIFDFWSYQIRAAFKQRYELLGQKNQLTVEARYRDRDFDEVINPSINDYRRDKRTVFALENTLNISDALDVSLKLEHINNDSNLGSFDFNESVYTLAVNYAL